LHFARELRKTMTDPERIMWALLRDRGLQGQKFRRQHPWLPYTLDFYCHELKLAVEIDGSQHADSPTDAGRDAALREAGIETVRYWNHDVVHRTEQVLEDLWGRMLERAPSPPAPLPGGEGSAVPSLAAPLPAGAGGGAAMSRDDAKRAFDDAILERLVALNAERAAEEARGHIRWLRPEFQNPQATAAPQQTELDATTEDDIPSPLAGEGGAQRRERGTPDKPIPWPKDTVEQVRAVADLLAASPAPLSLHEIEARFTSRGAWKKRLPQLVEMLVALGRAEVREGGVVGVGR
jgi:very-short-patch-repair endonuclease